MPAIVTVPRAARTTPPPKMDADDLMPINHGEEIMDTSTDEQMRLSKSKLLDSMSFSYAGGSLTSALAKVSALCICIVSALQA